MKNLESKILILIYLVSNFAYGQIKFGAKAGVGISNTTVVHGISKDRIGLVVGGVAKYQLSTRSEESYLQAEILYTNQGEYSLDLENKKYKAYIDYINIPIMYKFYFDNQGSDFFIETGPQIGFVISDNIDPLGPEANNNVLKKFDLAINAGIGYSYQRKYEFNIRYGIGLIDTYGNNISNNDINRSSLLSFSVTYFFN